VPIDKPSALSVSKDPDARIRLAAFERLRFLTGLYSGALPWAAVRDGFFVDGRHFLFASAAEGIFKPREMSTLLSVKTVVPKPRGRVWYSDQVDGDERIRSASDVLHYSFTGTDPANTRNQLLRDALERQLPIIYFYGVAPATYEPLLPVFVVNWDESRLAVSLAVSMPAEEVGIDWAPPEPAVRRYAMRIAKHRLHQAMFREQVADAYGQRCALSGLPEIRLLDAAHIVPDGDEALGQPDVRNGILMSRTHHSAYDTGLLGIDPDCQIHIAESLMEMHDGPMLEGIKALHGRTLRVPQNDKFRPDRDRLALRFEGFNRSRGQGTSCPKSYAAGKPS
jgi:putative restriction endonuclease